MPREQADKKSVHELQEKKTAGISMASAMAALAAGFVITNVAKYADRVRTQRAEEKFNQEHAQRKAEAAELVALQYAEQLRKQYRYIQICKEAEKYIEGGDFERSLAHLRTIPVSELHVEGASGTIAAVKQKVVDTLVARNQPVQSFKAEQEALPQLIADADFLGKHQLGALVERDFRARISRTAERPCLGVEYGRIEQIVDEIIERLEPCCSWFLLFDFGRSKKLQQVQDALAAAKAHFHQTIQQGHPVNVLDFLRYRKPASQPGANAEPSLLEAISLKRIQEGKMPRSQEMLYEGLNKVCPGFSEALAQQLALPSPVNTSIPRQTQKGASIPKRARFKRM